MKIVTLTRMAYTEQGVFGLLRSGDATFCTIERPWKHNEPFNSCIPCGTYAMKKGKFKSLYANYELQDVPGRWSIEMHRGNVASEFQGCIGVAMKQGIVNDKWAILDSTNGMKTFMLTMNSTLEAMIVIVNYQGGMI